MRRAVALIFAAACGVRAPAPVDVASLVATRGPEEAHRDLQARVLAHPRDIAARLALAHLAEEQGRPSEAIEQYETVENLGGPLGVRWHHDDALKLGWLLIARGHERVSRNSPTALADFQHAAKLGARAGADDLENAERAIAFEQLRHVDAAVRANGRKTLADRVEGRGKWGGLKPASVELRALFTAWQGARPTASPEERGRFGVWLWSIGARREAFEQLAAWHDATKAPRDESLQGAYLRALAWWSPTWLGEVPPPPAEDLVGPERCWFPSTDCVPPVVAPVPPSPLEAVDVPEAADARALVAARYAATRMQTAVPVRPLVAMAQAYDRDPAVAERLARDFVDRSVDAAAAHATMGAMFDVLGDPSRARKEWQAAVTASPEVAFLRGLAESAARSGDGPAALVFATRAAAASGDPAPVFVAVAEALVDGNRIPDALTAARSALELAGPEVLARALDVAIAASRAMRRTQQADALLVQRAQIAPLSLASADETELRAALIAHREQPTASTVARMWVASRSQPRDGEVRAVLLDELDHDDPRRSTIIDELLLLAGDPDAARARTAANAIRSMR